MRAVTNEAQINEHQDPALRLKQLEQEVGSKLQEAKTAEEDLEITKARLVKHAGELKTIAASLEAAVGQHSELEAKLDGKEAAANVDKAKERSGQSGKAARQAAPAAGPR